MTDLPLPGTEAVPPLPDRFAVERADAFDLNDDLVEVIELLPSGSFTRTRLCDQINSILSGHGWGSYYGTVE